MAGPKVDAAVAAITKTAPGTKAAGIAANVLHGGGVQHAGKRRCRQWTSSSIMPGSSVLSQASFKLYRNTRKPRGDKRPADAIRTAEGKGATVCLAGGTRWEPWI